MAYDYKNKSKIFFKSGNISIIARPANNAASSIGDFSSAGNLATIETNTGITIKPERDEQIFEGMDEDVRLSSKVKYTVNFTIGETDNKLIALFTGQDPEGAGVIDSTTETGFEIVQLWDNAEMPEFAMKIEGLDPNDKKTGYVFHNVTITAEELPPFKGKEKPALAVTAICDMNGGGSPGFAYLES